MTLFTIEEIKWLINFKSDKLMREKFKEIKDFRKAHFLRQFNDQMEKDAGNILSHIILKRHKKEEKKNKILKNISGNNIYK
jgi:hypothetical protein